jgi:hypothetical protein
VIDVTRLINGEVIVESSTMPDLRFRNQEAAHTWLASNHYLIVERARRYHTGDNISGTYAKPIAQTR